MNLDALLRRPSRKPGGLRGLDEVQQHRNEALRGLAVRVMTHPFKDHEAAAGDGFVRRDRVAHWNERVSGTPHNQRWKLPGVMQPTEGAQRLSAQVNHVAQAAKERTATIRIRERP